MNNDHSGRERQVSMVEHYMGGVGIGVRPDGEKYVVLRRLDFVLKSVGFFGIFKLQMD